MDLLYWLFDWLITRPLQITPRRCKLTTPDGETAYCRPSRKYSDKGRFKSICPLVDPVTLNPLTLGECRCSEGPGRAAEPAPKPAAAAGQASPERPGGHDARAELIPDESLEVVTCRSIDGPGEWVTVEAAVRNRSQASLSYASLEVEYLGAAGEVLARNLTIVGQLAPGEIKQVRLSKKVASCAGYRLRFRNVLLSA